MSVPVQTDFGFKKSKRKKRFTHGGARRGAGRKNLRQVPAHVIRPEISLRTPLHVTMKLRDGLPSLRTKNLLKIFRGAVMRARLKGLRIIHFSLQSNHLHLIVEARNKQEMSSIFRSLGTSLAHRLNRLQPIQRRPTNPLIFNPKTKKPSVFRGRYHLHALKTPTEVKHALRYVLLNETKHTRRPTAVDCYSSLARFESLPKLIGRTWKQWIKYTSPPNSVAHRENLQMLDEICATPSAWLLRVGWTKTAA